ncbi:hypothetical protein G8E05_06400 [Clostridium botulinum]|uniref:hypothetical protein n=1 Tax=Clostridium botulinum TaxID=1491 RepID=UPI000585FD77|nr:hypothetical protein [Clostridium botulinum]AJD25872.1 hypothetical protein T257_3127 [Clostridium botulinum CDC_297]MBY6878402.1 hypothetical protein [Clostridium botulinum]UOJ20673.1 hypothetical protein G8E05_06400 [Clostridium botulinum]WGZ46063.1 hypothetical protein HEQ52_07210 [Clostridium botulinum]HDI3024635.1 hypothetical protein [Clostridium botulinum]
MRIEKILKTQQPNTHKQLNKNRKQNNKKSRRGKEDLSFSDVMDLMSHDSYCRGKDGSIKQRTWGK